MTIEQQIRAAPVTEAPLSLNHFVGHIDNLNELKEVYQHLKEPSAKIDQLTDHGMTKSAYFFDPDRVL